MTQRIERFKTMWGQFFLHGATGIVPRLRIVFFSISAILLSAVAIGVVQIREMEGSVNHLADVSVKTFVQIEETERHLKTLLILLQQMDGAKAGETLSALVSDIQSHMKTLRFETSKLIHVRSTQDTSSSLNKEIEDIGAGVERTIEIKNTILETEDRMSASLQAQMDDLKHVNVFLHGILHDIAVSNGFASQVDDANALPSHKILEQWFFQRMQWANSATSIVLELEAIIAIAQGMKNMEQIQDLVKAETTIRFKLGSVAMLVTRLPMSPSRVELASQIKDIRDRLVGESGLLSQASGLIASRNALTQHIVRQQGPIENISAIAQGLAENGRRQIEISRKNLENVTRGIMTVMAIATVFSIVAIGSALIFIVERQINRRMARLTKAVLAIADGERNYRVDVSGPDELGKMAGALDVFKVNAAELHRSNAELEKFAYVAAHDLRSPLRAIQDLATWTLEDDKSHLSENSQENMTLLQKRIDRLNRLLSDLLEYSRVGMEDDNLGTVSVGKIVAETAELLDPDKKFDINFSGNCDFVCTYETPLRHILLNLISNGMKHHDRDTGRITVSTQYEAGRIIFEVQDNGPGIEPRYHDRIFGLFQTLRPRDEVEGSGLGLAIIAKLLEHYHGSIELRSNPHRARGSCFVFDLPDKSVATTVPKHAA